MRKLKEPNKVAFEPLEEALREKEDAEKERLNAFWGEFEYDLSFQVKRLKDVNLAREWFKKHILDFLRTSISRLQNGRTDGIQLWKWGDEDVWERIKYIIAFNTEFGYVEYDDEEPDPEKAIYVTSENLYDEEAFRFDVIKEFNKYILEGAALCKRIDSPAYDTWIEALVKLNDTYTGSKPYNAVDLIDKAYSRTWGDLCSWIHRNQAHKSKKTAKKSVKRKR